MSKPRYATAKNPTLQAVLGGHFRLADEAQAREKLALIAKNFTHSRHQIEGKQPSLHLWIKGFGLEEGDATLGVISHFAIIGYRKEQDYYTLHATKIPTPAGEHPQRAQVKRDNPNWGHPVLRAIRKGKIYPNSAAAQAELELLHREFPKVSIPNGPKLYLMIYCAGRKPKERLVKHILEIAPQGEGCIISAKENLPKPRVKAEPKPVQGYFTAKVAAKRRKRPEAPV